MSMLEEARSTLVKLVESQLTEVIRDACVVQRHTKRTRLAPPSEGKAGENDSSKNSIHSRRLLEAQDINLALQWRGCDKLFVTGVGAPFASGGGPSGDNDIETPLHNRDPRRRVIDLREYISSENTVQPPGEIGMKLHWLAVDGVQPAIPDNPTKIPGADGQPDNINSGTSLAHEALTVVDAPGNASGESEAAIQAKKLLPYLLSEELRLYFLRVTMTLEAVKKSGMTPVSTSAAAETPKPGGAEDSTKDDAKVKLEESEEHLLQTEKQKTLHKQTETVLHHIGIDSGLQELVPFLVQFVVKQLYECMNPGQSGKPGIIWYCRTLVRFVRQMISNSHLHLELHLHHLMPALLTCIVSKRVAPFSQTSPNAANYMSDAISLADSHWSLRREAAETVLLICDVFGDQYPTLKPRVLKTLCEAGLDLSKPLPTNYGGIVGLSLFGPKAIDAFLLPVAAEFYMIWEEELQNKSGNKRKAGSLQQDIDMRQCQQTMLNALSDYINSGEIFLDKNSVLHQESFKEVFEEKLIPMTVDLSHYAACFI